MPRYLLYGVLSFVFLAGFGVYLLTLNAAFQPDDSGETIATFVKLIPEHPSGYALHSLIGHLFTILPLGGVPFRSNFLGALGGAVGVTLAALLLLELLRERGKGVPTGALVSGVVAGSLSLAFSKTYWLQSLSAKGSIYILQACLLLAFLLFFQRGLEGASGRRPGTLIYPFSLALFVAALRLGIGLETLSLFILAFLASLAVLRKPVFTPFSIKGSPFLLTVALLGASVLLLPPLEQAAGRPNLWADAGTYQGFRFLSANSVIHEEMGSVYWKALTDLGKTPWDLGSFREHGPQLWAQWKRAWDHLAGDVGWWAWVPALFGLGAFFSRRLYWLLAFNLALVLLTMAAMVAGVEWNPAEFWCIDKFLLPANILWALMVGLGTCDLASRTGLFAALGPRRAQTRQVPTWRGWTFIPLLALSFAVPVLSLAFFYPFIDQSRQTGAYDYAMDLARSLEKDSLFLAEGDNALFSALFVQEGLDKRKDVTLVPVMDLWTDGGIGILPHLLPGLVKNGELGPLGAGARVKTCMERIIRRYGGQRPVEVSADFDLLYNCYFGGLKEVTEQNDLSLLLAPCGLLMEYGRDAGKPLEPRLLPLNWVRPSLPQGRVSEPMDLLWADKSQSYLNAADYCRSRRLWDQADHYYGDALGMSRNPRLLSEAWRGRGDLDWAKGLQGMALESYSRSIALFANRESYFQLIACYSHASLPQEALKTAQGLVQAFPREPLSWYKLAACEEAAGEKERAVRAFRQGLELEKKQ